MGLVARPSVSAPIGICAVTLPALGLSSFPHPTRPLVGPVLALDSLEPWPTELGSKYPSLANHQAPYQWIYLLALGLLVLPTTTPPRGLSTDSHDGMHDGVGDLLRTDKEPSIMCRHGWAGQDEIRCLRLRQRRGSLPAHRRMERAGKHRNIQYMLPSTHITACCYAILPPQHTVHTHCSISAASCLVLT